MNILYIGTTQQFSAPNAGFSHIYNFTKTIKEFGHNIYIVLKYDKSENIGKRIEYEGMTIHLENFTFERTFPKLTYNTFRHRKSNKKLQKWIKDYDIDIIHERMEVPGGLATYYNKFSSLPFLLEANDAFLFDTSYMNGIDKFIYKRGLKTRKNQLISCSMLITQTEILKRIFEMDTKVPIKVIPNAADPKMFSPEVAPKIVFKKSEKIIGFAGANRKWHGVEDLLQAFKIVARKIPKTKLLLIGQDLDEYNNNKDIISPGGINYSEIPAYLASCNVLVAPFNSKMEPGRGIYFQKYGMWWSPLKIFEYMAMAKPVISPKVGVIDEYIKDAGLTYQEGDVEELALRIIELLGDDELALKLGVRGRKKVLEEYNWKSQCKKVIKLYQQILKGF